MTNKCLVLTSLGLAFRDVVHPVTDARIPVVGEARGARVLGGLTVPAGPEHSAVVDVGEDAEQVGAVGRGDGWFCGAVDGRLSGGNPRIYVSKCIWKTN